MVLDTYMIMVTFFPPLFSCKFDCFHGKFSSRAWCNLLKQREHVSLATSVWDGPWVSGLFPLIRQQHFAQPHFRDEFAPWGSWHFGRRSLISGKPPPIVPRAVFISFWHAKVNLPTMEAYPTVWAPPQITGISFFVLLCWISNSIYGTQILHFIPFKCLCVCVYVCTWVHVCVFNLLYVWNGKALIHFFLMRLHLLNLHYSCVSHSQTYHTHLIRGEKENVYFFPSSSASQLTDLAQFSSLFHRESPDLGGCLVTIKSRSLV